MRWESQSLSAEEQCYVLLHLEKNRNNKRLKMTCIQALMREASLCVEVLSDWADLKEPALSKPTDQKLYFLLVFLVENHKVETEVKKHTELDENTYFLATQTALCLVRVD